MASVMASAQGPCSKGKSWVMVIHAKQGSQIPPVSTCLVIRPLSIKSVRFRPLHWVLCILTIFKRKILQWATIKAWPWWMHACLRQTDAIMSWLVSQSWWAMMFWWRLIKIAVITSRQDVTVKREVGFGNDAHVDAVPTGIETAQELTIVSVTDTAKLIMNLARLRHLGREEQHSWQAVYTLFFSVCLSRIVSSSRTLYRKNEGRVSSCSMPGQQNRLTSFKYKPSQTSWACHCKANYHEWPMLWLGKASWNWKRYCNRSIPKSKIIPGRSQRAAAADCFSQCFRGAHPLRLPSRIDTGAQSDRRHFRG